MLIVMCLDLSEVSLALKVDAVMKNTLDMKC